MLKLIVTLTFLGAAASQRHILQPDNVSVDGWTCRSSCLPNERETTLIPPGQVWVQLCSNPLSKVCRLNNEVYISAPGDPVIGSCMVYDWSSRETFPGACRSTSTCNPDESEYLTGLAGGYQFRVVGCPNDSYDANLQRPILGKCCLFNDHLPNLPVPPPPFTG